MKQNVKWMAIALMMAAITVGCESGESSSIAEPTPNEPVTIEDNERQYIMLNTAQIEMVNESNNFAFNLFRQNRLTRCSALARRGLTASTSSARKCWQRLPNWIS